MYLFRIFYSFLPLRNPIGFGASDFLVFAIAICLSAVVILRHWLEPIIRSVAPRTTASMALLFVAAVSLRLALLPQSPVPLASGADDFSYVLLGDTLRHFRMANPPHELHQFFESVFVLQQPTYSSIYPLGQGIVLAMGRLFLHSFWLGVLASSGLFCALCYWMLRAWVAPVWAFLGGLLAMISLGPLSSWVNSYWGGYLSGIAGCLVFGSLPRLQSRASIRNGALLGLGLGLQILSRPFESLFLALPAALYLIYSFRRNLRHLFRPALVATLGVLLSLGCTALQNKSVTRSWTAMPYVLSRYQYGVPTTFTFQANPIPHVALTPEQEMDYKAQAAIHGSERESVRAYAERLNQRFRYLRFFIVPPLYLALFAFVPCIRQKRYLFVCAVIAAFVLGTNFYPYFYPHYIAAIASFFILLFVVGLQRLSKFFREPVLLVCFGSFAFWFGLYLQSNEDLLSVSKYQAWNYINRGDPEGRASIEQQLAASPGKQLVFVRYAPAHQFAEWVYNDADIDSAKTIWANDLGPGENQTLLNYYPSRKAWLLNPDVHPVTLLPYPKTSEPFQTIP